MDALIEIFLRGKWVPAASIHSMGAERCTVEYLPEYMFSDSPQTISLGMPLEFSAAPLITPDGGGLEYIDRSLPPFLFDLIPQGKGRSYLIAMLELQDSDSLQMPLLLSGAFNPIGNLRIDTAVDFYRKHKDEGASDDLSAMMEGGGGFTMEDIVKKSEGFLNHLSLHAMLAAGTTGVQGVAPKFLLTQNAEGRWFADLALPDDLAHAHWLVKLPRGRSDADRAVLRNEAAYLRAASACGLRAEHEPLLVGEMLFVRRFDREVGPQGLRRLHQESLASVAGLQGFAPKVDQGLLLNALRARVSDPKAETIEFLKRDALNVALRNTDNHARNTALQRLHDGTVRMTPVYDFAPMFMDPEMVPRSSNWILDGRREESFAVIIDRLDIPDGEKAEIAGEMREFANCVAHLPELGRACGIEPDVLEQCRMSIDRVANDLARIDVSNFKSAPKVDTHGQTPEDTRPRARRRPS